MEYFKRCTILIVVFLISCTDANLPEPGTEFDEVEMALIGLWKYERLMVNSQAFEIADEFMNALGNKVSLRDEVVRRRIRYDENYNYQIEWTDRGDYELGEEGTPNWQPAFGTWRITADGDSLIHNGGTVYETRYALNLVPNAISFSRQSQRYMSNSGPGWSEGDVIRYQEFFIEVEQ